MKAILLLLLMMSVSAQEAAYTIDPTGEQPSILDNFLVTYDTSGKIITKVPIALLSGSVKVERGEVSNNKKVYSGDLSEIIVRKTGVTIRGVPIDPASISETRNVNGNIQIASDLFKNNDRSLVIDKEGKSKIVDKKTQEPFDPLQFLHLLAPNPAILNPQELVSAIEDGTIREDQYNEIKEEQMTPELLEAVPRLQLLNQETLAKKLEMENLAISDGSPDVQFRKEDDIEKLKLSLPSGATLETELSELKTGKVTITDKAWEVEKDGKKKILYEYDASSVTIPGIGKVTLDADSFITNVGPQEYITNVKSLDLGSTHITNAEQSVFSFGKKEEMFIKHVAGNPLSITTKVDADTMISVPLGPGATYTWSDHHYSLDGKGSMTLTQKNSLQEFASNQLIDLRFKPDKTLGKITLGKDETSKGSYSQYIMNTQGKSLVSRWKTRDGPLNIYFDKSFDALNDKGAKAYQTKPNQFDLEQKSIGIKQHVTISANGHDLDVTKDDVTSAPNTKDTFYRLNNRYKDSLVVNVKEGKQTHSVTFHDTGKLDVSNGVQRTRSIAGENIALEEFEREQGTPTKPEGGDKLPPVRLTAYYTPVSQEQGCEWYPTSVARPLNLANIRMEGSGIIVKNIDGQCVEIIRDSLGDVRLRGGEADTGKTARGLHPQAGRTIAVNNLPDTDCYIPYFRTVWIEVQGEPQNPYNGCYIAEDTGSAFKGQCKIDIYAGIGFQQIKTVERSISNKMANVWITPCTPSLRPNGGEKIRNSQVASSTVPSNEPPATASLCNGPLVPVPTGAQCGGMSPGCLVRESVANPLQQAENYANAIGRSLIVTSAYRPTHNQKLIFSEKKLSRKFVCGPNGPPNLDSSYSHCPHVSGCAVDIYFNSGKSFEDSKRLTDLYANELIAIMSKAGFVRLRAENHHFEYGVPTTAPGARTSVIS